MLFVKTPVTNFCVSAGQNLAHRRRFSFGPPIDLPMGSFSGRNQPLWCGQGLYTSQPASVKAGGSQPQRPVSDSTQGAVGALTASACGTTRRCSLFKDHFPDFPCLLWFDTLGTSMEALAPRRRRSVQRIMGSVIFPCRGMGGHLYTTWSNLFHDLIDLL